MTWVGVVWTPFEGSILVASPHADMLTGRDMSCGEHAPSAASRLRTRAAHAGCGPLRIKIGADGGGWLNTVTPTLSCAHGPASALVRSAQVP